MVQTERPAWVDGVCAAAVRLAAEADADVADILLHHGNASPEQLATPVTRLEQSAGATEVATDLAGLLWAESEDSPPILMILEEPATQAALEAVAEARRQAAQRLVTTATPPCPPPAPPAGPIAEAPRDLPTRATDQAAGDRAMTTRTRQTDSAPKPESVDALPPDSVPDLPPRPTVRPAAQGPSATAVQRATASSLPDSDPASDSTAAWATLNGPAAEPRAVTASSATSVPHPVAAAMLAAGVVAIIIVGRQLRRT